MSTRQDSAAIAVFAPAKVNLALHVVGRRPDGYHELDTLVAFADIGDVLYAEAAGEISLRVDGRFAAGLPRETDRNLVKLAAERLRLAAQAAGHAPNGARLLLVKELPVASGIGGGSTDAAATLLALRELWDLPADFDLSAIAASLGADVMMCLAAVALRARDRPPDRTSRRRARSCLRTRQSRRRSCHPRDLCVAGASPSVAPAAPAYRPVRPLLSCRLAQRSRGPGRRAVSVDRHCPERAATRSGLPAGAHERLGSDLLRLVPRRTVGAPVARPAR
jgi:hypothetical protein